MLFQSKQKLNTSCRYVNGGLIFTADNKITICDKSSDILSNELIIYDKFNGINFDAAELKAKLEELKYNYSNRFDKKECLNCYNFENIKSKEQIPLNFIELNHWKSCFLNCKYCNYAKTDDLSTVSHYDVTPIIQDMLDKNLINKQTKIIIGCGDALLHPEFDKLMYFFINNDMKDIDIYTPLQRYCHSIAEAIDKKIARLFVSFDSACPYIYQSVKGYNKFDIAVSNLKRYLEFNDKSSKRIILTYKLVKGVNDNKKEILDWFMMSRGLGIKKLFVDIEQNWYDELINSSDENLNQLIIFIKELSLLNNYDIEFSLKLNKLFKQIEKDTNVCI